MNTLRRILGRLRADPELLRLRNAAQTNPSETTLDAWLALETEPRAAARFAQNQLSFTVRAHVFAHARAECLAGPLLDLVLKEKDFSGFLAKVLANPNLHDAAALRIARHLHGVLVRLLDGYFPSEARQTMRDLLALHPFPSVRENIDLAPLAERFATDRHIDYATRNGVGVQLFKWEGLDAYALTDLYRRLSRDLDDGDWQDLVEIAQAPATPESVIRQMVFASQGRLQDVALTAASFSPHALAVAECRERIIERGPPAAVDRIASQLRGEHYRQAYRALRRQQAWPSADMLKAPGAEDLEEAMVIEMLAADDDQVRLRAISLLGPVRRQRSNAR